MSTQAINYNKSFHSPSSIYGSPKKEAIKIETKTSAKKINIEWTVNKQAMDIAKLSLKGEKKGVIGTSVQYGNHLINLELCLPGWRRSEDGFSAFYLTVPLKTKQRLKNNETVNENKKDSNDFVARYTICFGHNGDTFSRVSSIRNDFDLGVGFPNFAEISTLMNAVHKGELIFKIYVEIYEYASTIREPLMYKFQKNENSIAGKLISKMYYDKSNYDAIIIVNNKHIKVHKCVLATASPVFHKIFKQKKNGISKLFLKKWNINIVDAMIKFLYLGKIDLNNKTTNVYEDYDEFECGLSLNNYDSESDVKSDEEETKSLEDEIKSEIINQDDINQNIINKLIFYCGENTKKLFQLFQIAEYYQIDPLMIECCNKFHLYISRESCCFFLIYLDKYVHLNEIKDGKCFILDFIVRNIKSIKNTKGYLYLLQNEPKLLNEIIDTLPTTNPSLDQNMCIYTLRGPGC